MSDDLQRVRSPIREVLGKLIPVSFGLGFAAVLAGVIVQPTKRGVEALAGVVLFAILWVVPPLVALLVLVSLVPFPLHTSYGTTNTLLIFVLAMLAMIKSREAGARSPFLHKGADTALAAFSMTIAVSLIYQDLSEFAEVRDTFLGLISAVVLYYVIVYLIQDVRSLRKVMVVGQVLGFLQAVIANLQSMFPTTQFLPTFFKFSRKVASMEEIRAGEVRAFGTFSGYETFAEYLAMNVILQYALYRCSSSLAWRTFWVVNMAVTTLALFRTGTRAGIIILVGGVLYMVIVGGRAAGRATLLKNLFIVTMILYLLLPFLQGEIAFLIDRMSTIGLDDSSVQSRSVVLEQALDGIPDSPVIGHGPYQEPGHFRGGVSQHIHNLYVTLAYKFGIPSLLMFLYFLSVLFRRSYALTRAYVRDREAHMYMMALHVTLVMWIVDQVKIEFTRSSLSAHIVFIHFGMVMALTFIIQRQQNR